MAVEQLWQDLRYSLRLMRRSPGFTAVAVLSLALGMGVNTAIFSLMYAVMLRLLPVKHPEQLVELLHRLPREGHRGNSFTFEAYQDLRDHNDVLSALIAAAPSGFYLRGEGLEPEKMDWRLCRWKFLPGAGHAGGGRPSHRPGRRPRRRGCFNCCRELGLLENQAA